MAPRHPPRSPPRRRSRLRLRSTSSRFSRGLLAGSDPRGASPRGLFRLEPGTRAGRHAKSVAVELGPRTMHRTRLTCLERYWQSATSRMDRLRRDWQNATSVGGGPEGEKRAGIGLEPPSDAILRCHEPPRRPGTRFSTATSLLAGPKRDSPAAGMFQVVLRPIPRSWARSSASGRRFRSGKRVLGPPRKRICSYDEQPLQRVQDRRVSVDITAHIDPPHATRW